jgi:hypothetical protein
MKIINLRTVGSFEIPDSFRGILRISPNDGIDDPSSLITTVGTEIILSDSIGTELPIKFKVKSFNVKLVERNNIDMINLAHNYSNLYITKSLHIRPTLYIDKNNDPINNRPPLIFIKDGNAVGYPLEAPDDIRYANWNNRLGTSAFETLSPSDKKFNDLFGENGKYKSEHIIIDGTTQYQYISHLDKDGQHKYYKVPEINRRIYALGSCPGHTYKVSDFNIGSHDLSGITSNIPTGRYTQLSFVNLDNIPAIYPKKTKKRNITLFPFVDLLIYDLRKSTGQDAPKLTNIIISKTSLIFSPLFYKIIYKINSYFYLFNS